MIILFYILVLLGTFIVMEGITWCTHKYVMHGFLWILHKDHHEVRQGIFEKNDLFAFIFAVPSFLLIYFGTYDHMWWMQSTGFGIMLYGVAYFFVHDVYFALVTRWWTVYILQCIINGQTPTGDTTILRIELIPLARARIKIDKLISYFDVLGG